MAPIKGRPKQAKRQEKFLGFFVTKMQDFVIQQKAAKAGVTISDYMRQVAIDSQIKPRWTEEERSMVKRLIAMSGDIQKLAAEARKEGALRTALSFAKYGEALDEILNKLCHDR
ncbi:plasmid mobilization protein [Puia dinghuensis]|uniref:Uncharacterized protein n=1 Tax=Puia dinghuensis TaxID=1792502 RepID=A0A8J2UGM9_9BACT|nr:hypothetical protein [Puia dinghuensis]GGB14822.1 hypothetical protein GCM10011511_43220 [Puia dinghuensis]